MGARIERTLAAWMLTVTALGGWACPSGPSKSPEEPTLARLEQLTGQVQWRPPSRSDWLAATEGQALAVGARLRTSADGRTAVVFADGRRLAVQPESEFELSQIGGQLALSLIAGELDVSSEAEGASGFRLVFQDDEEAIVLQRGRVRLRRASDGTVDLQAVSSSQSGFRLMFADETQVQVQREGQIQLSRDSGGLVFKTIIGTATIQRGEKTEDVKAGHAFRLTIGKGEVTHRERIASTLKDRRRSTRIRTPNATRFVAPGRSAVALEPGTAIQNRGQADVEISDEAGGRVMLGPGSQAVFEGSYKAGSDRDGLLALDSGRARVELRRQAGGGARQEVVTPHARVVASAKGLTAELTVHAKRNETQVLVHTGQAEVEFGNQTIPLAAGQSLTVPAKGQATDAPPQPQSLAAPLVPAREGARTLIFYDKPISSVALRWPRPAEAGQTRLEVSPTADFKALDLQEPVLGTSFALHGLQRGRTYWRLLRGQGPGQEVGSVGSVELQPDPGARRRGGQKLTNVVHDTGVQTKIIFQGKAPALTLTWKPLPQAKNYRVRVFTGEDLETPIIETVQPGTRLVLPAERLKEGSYYWYQSALDAAGASLASSQMNKLVLAFDNATSLMRIDSPASGARPAGGSLEVAGLAPRGAQVMVNNKPLLLGSEGRFDQVLTGLQPGGTLIFHLRQRELGDVYYLRQLGR